MRHKDVSRILRLATASTLLAWTFGCSSANEESDAKLVPTEGGDDDAEAKTLNEAATAESAANAAKNAPAAPEKAPAVAATPVATAASPERVVRYVAADQLDIHGQPSDTAPAVGTLLKGERVLVVEANGWGSISGGMFVKLDQLSSRAVARERQPAQWQAPAH